VTRVVFDPAALDDFIQAVKYYDKQQNDLGSRFKENVETALESIVRMPLGYRLLKPPFRRCLVSKFPYGIIFTIEAEFIYVVAIAHAKRKPYFWPGRVQS